MPKGSYSQKKVDYFERLTDYVANYNRILIIEVDNIGSKQMSDVRVSLRGKGTVLMGKNTMTRRALMKLVPQNSNLSALLNTVRYNMGFVFCECEPSEVRNVILESKFPEYAKTGVVAPTDVFVPPGPTGMDPGQTSFFQALGIATKIVKSQIEIQSTVHLVHEGEKVSPSAATLLQKLNIKPFTYGIKVKSVYENGNVYDAKFLDIDKEEIIQSFKQTCTQITAFGLATDIPSIATIPHTVTYVFKQMMALVADTDVTFPQMKNIREQLDAQKNKTQDKDEEDE